MFRKIIGAVIGGVLGLVYWKTVGCSTGTCPITSNPWSSVGYGILMGTLIAS